LIIKNWKWIMLYVSIFVYFSLIFSVIVLGNRGNSYLISIVALWAIMLCLMTDLVRQAIKGDY